MQPILQDIWRFPIKGFQGQRLDSVTLEQSAGIPGDRRFAITRGTHPTDTWLQSGSFYVNAHVDNLPTFKIDPVSENGISVTNSLGSRIDLDFDDPASIARANESMTQFMIPAGIDPDLPIPQIMQQKTQRGIWDFVDTPLSIINSASVAEIGDAMGEYLDPVRFRGNLVVNIDNSWDEFSWIGKRIRIGEAEIEVFRPIPRCPAPGVNPESGKRDIDFAARMPEHFGHAYCGVYAVTTKPGKIFSGAQIEIVGDAELPLTQALANAEDYRMWPRMVEITSCEVGENITRISLAKASPWPLPQATPGQRLRLLMGKDRWTSEYIAATSQGQYHLEVSKSETADPVTEHLRTAYKPGDRFAICGPFGRA